MKNKYLPANWNSPLVYFLNEEDVQNVAREHLERELTDEEIKKLIEPISENINWSESIVFAIDEHIKN